MSTRHHGFLLILLLLVALTSAVHGSNDKPGTPRGVTCRQLLAADVPNAYAAGLLDGARALEITFRTSVETLQGQGDTQLAEGAAFVADAIAERLGHADGYSAEALAGRIRESCAGDPDGTAELHFILALEGWRRSQPL